MRRYVSIRGIIILPFRGEFRIVSSGYDNNYHARSQHICQSAHYILYYIVLKSTCWPPIRAYLSKYLSYPSDYGLSTTTQQLFLLLPCTCPPPPHAVNVWLTFFCLSLPHHPDTADACVYVYNIIIYYLLEWTTTRQVVWIEFLNNFVPTWQERP